MPLISQLFSKVFRGNCLPIFLVAFPVCGMAQGDAEPYRALAGNGIEVWVRRSEPGLGMQGVGWGIKNLTADTLEVHLSKTFFASPTGRLIKSIDGSGFYSGVIVGPYEMVQGARLLGDDVVLWNDFFYGDDLQKGEEIGRIEVTAKVINLSGKFRQEEQLAKQLAARKAATLREAQAKAAVDEQRRTMEAERKRALEEINQQALAVQRSHEQTQQSISRSFSDLADMITGKAEDRARAAVNTRDEEEARSRNEFLRDLKGTTDIQKIIALTQQRIEDVEWEAETAIEQADYEEETAGDYQRHASFSSQFGATQFGSDLTARMNEGYARAHRISARAERARASRLESEARQLMMKLENMRSTTSANESHQGTASAVTAIKPRSNSFNQAEEYFLKGNSIKDTNWEQAVEYWLLAAQYGHTGCKEWAAKIANENFEKGNRIKDTDRDKAIEYWLNAARYGHQGCKEWASKIANENFEKGNKIKDTNKEQAIEYWLSAARYGHQSCQEWADKVGNDYLQKGNEVADTEPDRAIGYWILAAKYGNKTCLEWIVKEKVLASEEGEFRDARDNQTYKWVRIGNKKWMAENLNHETQGSYKTDVGRLYTWEAAMNACPSGWHLSSDKEWSILTERLGGFRDAGKMLKSKTGWQNFYENSGNGTNASGFAALPNGLRKPDGKYESVKMFGYWWTSTESGSEYPWCRELSYHNNSVYRSNTNYDREHALSVRCVSD